MDRIAVARELVAVANILVAEDEGEYNAKTYVQMLSALARELGRFQSDVAEEKRAVLRGVVARGDFSKFVDGRFNDALARVAGGVESSLQQWEQSAKA